MAVVKNLMVRAGADFSELEKELQKASKSLKNAGRELSNIGKSLTVGLTVPIVAAGAASFKLAADMEDALGASDQIFGKASGAMQEWAKNLESYYGIASGEALEYGNMMGSMLQNIGGLTEQEAAKQSQTLIKLAGDLTAMYGGTTQEAVRALTGALKGNNTMLDNYGMAVNDAMVKTKAMKMRLYDGTGQMSLAAKQAATLALIMEQSGAAQGQAAREADGASGSMRAMTTELKNLAASFGEILLPVITPFITKINELVQKFGALDEGTKKTIVTVLGIAAAVGPFLMLLGGLATTLAKIATIGKTVSTISKGAKAAIALLSGSYKMLTASILPAIAAKIADKAETLAIIALYAKDAVVKAASTLATKAMTIAQGAWNVIAAAGALVTKALGVAIGFLTSPIGLVLIAIAALIAIGILLYKNWDKISAWFKTTCKDIGKFFKNMVDGIKTAFINFGKTIKEKWESLWSGVKDFFKGIWDGIVDFAEDRVNSIINLINGVIKLINKIPGVSIGTIGTVDWNGNNSIQKHADGGIFTRPTLWGNHLMGEAGPEALVPLDRLAGAGSSANIIVELDGYTLAKAMGQPLADMIRVKTGLRI